MVLAAGLGTRLRPLTDDRPKALVEISGRTLLEITFARLRAFGILDVIVNVHHFADMVVDYLAANNDFGMHIEISREEILLDTGGGLKKAAYFFAQDRNRSDDAFILHNVDVLSTIDLRRMLQFHNERQAFATLAVQERKTSRYLLFDEQLQLCGRRSGNDQTAELVRPSARAEALGFCGVQVISPRIFSRMTEGGAFPIVPCYLRLAGQGERILAFRADEYYWRDLGRLEDVAQAAQDLKEKALL
jgi:NDP-sugar pyrophosphorylase family protein